MRLGRRAVAKVNLHLEVRGRRDDGYHELRTVFQTIDLADEIEIVVGGCGISIEVSSSEVPAGPENLAWRAARAFRRRWAPDTGVAIRLEKRIPVGGGLGGGSSDAAVVLRLLRKAVGEPRDPEDLIPVARELGADVPYFLLGGTALGLGRGDRIVPLAELPEREMVLVVPPVPVSTAEVFGDLGHLTAADPDPRIMAIVQSGQPTWDAVGFGSNDLERSVVSRWSVIGAVRRGLVEAGARVARLSGSGSSVFALFDGSPGVGELEPFLPEGCRVERVRTVSRSALRG